MTTTPIPSTRTRTLAVLAAFAAMATVALVSVAPAAEATAPPTDPPPPPTTDPPTTDPPPTDPPVETTEPPPTDPPVETTDPPPTDPPVETTIEPPESTVVESSVPESSVPTETTEPVESTVPETTVPPVPPADCGDYADSISVSEDMKTVTVVVGDPIAGETVDVLVRVFKGSDGTDTLPIGPEGGTVTVTPPPIDQVVTYRLDIARQFPDGTSLSCSDRQFGEIEGIGSPFAATRYGCVKITDQQDLSSGVPFNDTAAIDPATGLLTVAIDPEGFYYDAGENVDRSGTFGDAEAEAAYEAEFLPNGGDIIGVFTYVEVDGEQVRFNPQAGYQLALPQPGGAPLTATVTVRRIFDLHYSSSLIGGGACTLTATMQAPPAPGQPTTPTTATPAQPTAPAPTAPAPTTPTTTSPLPATLPVTGSATAPLLMLGGLLLGLGAGAMLLIRQRGVQS